MAERMMAFPVTGVDISDRTIKFMRFRKAGRFLRPDAHGNVDLPAGVVVEGEIHKPDLLIEALKRLSVGPRFSEQFVIASLPEEKGFVRVIEVPRAKMDNLSAALQWELEGNIPLPPEETYFDYEVVEASSTIDHASVVTVAFPRPIVDAYVSVLANAGMKPVALEIESQSITRALLDRTHLENPVIICDIGTSRTSFVLTQHGSIAFTSTIPLSGQSLNKAISAALGVDESEAETIKKSVGLKPDEWEGKVFAALQPVLTSLVDELEKHIHFYHDHLADRGNASADIQSIICTGGDASLIGLDAYLAKSLRKPVVIGDPFVSLAPFLGEQRPPVAKNVSLQFSTAVGLSLREFDL